MLQNTMDNEGVHIRLLMSWSCTDPGRINSTTHEEPEPEPQVASRGNSHKGGRKQNVRPVFVSAEATP
jgi:hypothetical protein